MGEIPEYKIVERIMYRTRLDRATGCWMWQGSTTGSGYPDCRYNGTHRYVHRLMHIIHNGHLSDEKPFVCHTCDNPQCVNPEHLWAGSHTDNIQDAADKGRVPTPQSHERGEDHHGSKLTENDVVEIREKYANTDLTQYDLADEYGVIQPHIGSIVRGEDWSHVGGPTK